MDGNQLQIIKSYQKNIVQFLSGKHYIPLTLVAMKHRLSIPNEYAELFKQSIATLLKQNKITRANRRYSLYEKEENKFLSGTLSLNVRGFGFVIPQDRKNFPRDFFIPKFAMEDAVHGDLVEVRIVKNEEGGKGPEGIIHRVIKRGSEHLTAHVVELGDNQIQAYSPLIGPKHRITVKEINSDHQLRKGDRIFIRMIRWGGEGQSGFEANFIRLIGHIDDPSYDVDVALEEFSIPYTFSDTLTKDLNQLSTTIDPQEIKKRTDLRQLLTITIDPTTAKDFDDALSIKKTNDGYTLWVHIADVSHYVTRGSLIDEEAKLRCNSTYFPGKCIPMLPAILSNEICSLKPAVDRLVITVEMKFSLKGVLKSFKHYRALIHSDKRFTYEEAYEVLQGKQQSEYLAILKQMKQLCLVLKKQRSLRGSVEFNLPEAVLQVDDQGVPLGIQIVDYDITHQMVEEFMLSTNYVIAQLISKKNLPLPYRIHEEPSVDTMQNFSQLAKILGYDLPSVPSLEDLQNLFKVLQGSQVERQLTIGFIRSMKLAIYSEQNKGHYGLGLEHYCHFTSPIRRYVDLVVHRVLTGSSYTSQEIEAIAQLCSENERISAKAEQTTTLLKKVRYLLELHKSSPNKVYQAVVTKVNNFGISFEVPDIMLDGFLTLRCMNDDYYCYCDSTLSLKGRHQGKIFSIGKPIKVSVLSIDLMHVEVSWKLDEKSKNKSKGRKRYVRKRK